MKRRMSKDADSVLTRSNPTAVVVGTINVMNVVIKLIKLNSWSIVFAIKIHDDIYLGFHYRICL